VVGSCIYLFRASQLTDVLRVLSLPGDGIIAPITLVIFAAVLVIVFKKDRLFAGILILAPLVGNIIKFLLKTHYSIPRPEVFGCDVLANYGDKYSFPSGHTIFYTIFFGLLAYYSIQNWKDMWTKFVLPLSLFFILSVGYSRIYLGAHWYLDILGGYIVGGAILTICIMIYRHFKRAKEHRLFDKKGNVRAAGAIISRTGVCGREYLLVYRKFQNDYSFPKGKIEIGETPKMAAIREVEEETGYIVNIDGKLDNISYNYPEGGSVLVKMFEGKIATQGKKKETNEKELWVLEKKVVELLTYPNLKDYFQKYLEESKNV
jgi:membrane-associated phospholipid phosphatase